jgi:hypothetical protein
MLKLQGGGGLSLLSLDEKVPATTVETVQQRQSNKAERVIVLRA